MAHPSNPIDLTKEQLEHLIWDTPTTGKRLRQNLLDILGRRTSLVEQLTLCRGCEQIRVAQYPRKYCYVTCLPPTGQPVSDLRPEDEADLRLFTSNPTTRTLEATLEHWTNRDTTDHSLSLTAAYEWQDYMDLNADEIRAIQVQPPAPQGRTGQGGSQEHSREELSSSKYWDSARTATRSRHPAPGTNTATSPADPHRTPARPSIPNSKQRDASSTRIPRPESWTRCLKHSSTATENSSRHRPRRNEPATSAGAPVPASEHVHAP